MQQWLAFIGGAMLFMALIYLTTGAVEKPGLGEGQEEGAEDPSIDGDVRPVGVWRSKSSAQAGQEVEIEYDWKPDMDKY